MESPSAAPVTRMPSPKRNAFVVTLPKCADVVTVAGSFVFAYVAAGSVATMTVFVIGISKRVGPLMIFETPFVVLKSA